MDSQGSVSCWIDDARTGCDWAAARLWERYHPQLMAVARRKLEGSSRRVADEEDVVVSAFQSFLRRSRGGSYPDLSDRHQLRKLLVTITAHKALNQIRDQKRLKRSALGSQQTGVLDRPTKMKLAELVSAEPQPDFAAMMSDEFDVLLDLLDDEELKTIAIAKINGYTCREIADEIGRSVPTVERRLRLIRDKWRVIHDEWLEVEP